MILLQCLEPSYIPDPHHHTSRSPAVTNPPYCHHGSITPQHITAQYSFVCPCSEALLSSTSHHEYILPNYAPTLLRHRPLVSPPFTTAALDRGHMPLSHHVLQYRCVLLGQLQIWRVVTCRTEESVVQWTASFTITHASLLADQTVICIMAAAVGISCLVVEDHLDRYR
jgi:hypothetical protein